MESCQQVLFEFAPIFRKSLQTNEIYNPEGKPYTESTTISILNKRLLTVNKELITYIIEIRFNILQKLTHA
ncbi:hypothetical protein KBA01_13660 [Kozakia baliensis]|nr:hypothetical protein KBA01_13660 [Kozakia baliensis]